MGNLRWLDRSAPQTLITATILMYINAAFGILDSQALAFPIGTVLVLGQAAAALGIANDKKAAYWAGVAIVGLFVVFLLLSFSFVFILNLIIYVALLALLLHPQSREYRRVWFT